MRLAVAFIVVVAAGCAGDPELTYIIRDADPAVPLRAIHVFQLDRDGWPSMPELTSADEGEVLVMPHEGVIGAELVSPPLRICAIAVDATGDLLFSAASLPVEEVEDGLEISVDFQLEAHPDGTVPSPCGIVAPPSTAAGI